MTGPARLAGFHEPGGSPDADSACQQALRHAESRFRLLAENSPDWIFWMNPDGRIAYVSPACERVTGHSPDEFLADPGLMLRLVDPRDQALFAAHLALPECKESAEVVLRIIRRDGSLRWISHQCKGMRDEAGILLGRLGHNRDITVQRAAEDEVRKLSLAVEQCPNSVLVTDVEGRIEYVNAAFERTTGYSRDDIVGRNPRILESGRTPTAVFAELWNCLSRGDSWQGEFVNRRKSGEEYIDRAVVSPVRQADGRITHYLGIQEDITERKRQAEELAGYRYHLEALVAARTADLAEANAQLNRADARLQGMLALSQQAAALSEREILAWGIETAARLTGSEVGYAHLLNEDGETLQLGAWTTGTLARCTAAFEDHYPIAQAGVWADTVRTGRPVVHNDFPAMADRHGYPEGHFPITRHLGVPINDEGRVRLLLGVGNKAGAYNDGDVMQLELVGADLWRILRRRRLEVALARAKEDAEAAARSKSAFLANMSHEIRTPLNAIIGLTHMMRRAGPTPEQADRLAKIGGAADHLVAVINDILDISKIEAGKLVLERADFDLGAMLARICSFVAEKAQAKGLELVVDTDDLPETLNGDATRLGQALLNYLGNAVKFTERGSVILRASCAWETVREIMVRFEVEDTGIGLAPEQLARL
ncbi:MAG: PAS domain S-box protein, partial [Rhodocyclaceae bacterium]|nr:PAS domain S-box protein [Rhodocyclaceae bacterium]